MKKTQYFGRMMKIAVPIMLSNLISQLQMLIDKIFLGRLDIKCMTAVGNASSPMWTTLNTIFSLTVGATILVSQAIGEGDRKKAEKLTASLFLYNNFLALFWFFVWIFGARLIFNLMGVPESVIDMSISYVRIYSPVFLMTGLGAAIMSMLQVSEKTGIMIWYGVIRSGINIILDYVMIFGKFGFPRMEVAGASLATTIAEFCGAIVLSVYFLKAKDLWLRPKFTDVLRSKFSLYLSAVKLGLPTALEDFAWNFGSLFLIVMLNRVSDEAAGIYSIVFSVELLPVCLIGSLGSATLTLSGQETGKKDYAKIRRIAFEAMVFCLSISAVILALFILFPRVIMGWFTTDKAVIAASAVYLIIVGIDLFPKSGNIIAGSAIRGFGDTMWMLITQCFGTVFVIGMSAVVVLIFHGGISELFCVVVADEVLRCIINYWKMRKISN